MIANIARKSKYMTTMSSSAASERNNAMTHFCSCGTWLSVRSGRSVRSALRARRNERPEPGASSESTDSLITCGTTGLAAQPRPCPRE
jgi:hypothetical protein